MSLFIGLWKQSKNVKSWIINILKVLGRVLWLSNVWLKSLQLGVYWQSTSLLPFPSSKTTKQHKIIIHPSQPPKLLGYRGEKLCRFTILPLSHLGKFGLGLRWWSQYPATAVQRESPWRLVLTLEEIASVVPIVRQRELLWAPTAAEVSVWEGQPLVWLGLLCSSLVCSLLHVTFLKNSMYCFSIIKVRCFQYQKKR